MGGSYYNGRRRNGMAAELDEREDGKAAFMGVRLPAWHREGVILENAPSLTRALIEAGLEFEVEARPLYVAGMDGSMMEEPLGHRAIVRTDRGTVLGVVGGRYEPLQNLEAFSIFEPLLDSGIAEIETAGSLRGGRDVWMLVKYDRERLETDGLEGIDPFGLITNNHAGRRAVRMTETPIRVVCANTLSAALRGSGVVSVRHTETVGERAVAAAEEVFSDVRKRYAVVAEGFRQLKDTRLTEAMFKRLVLDAVVPLPRDPEAVVKEKTLERRNAILDSWHEGTGVEGDDSAWDAYNGLVEVFDHSPLYEFKKRSRVESIALGPLARLKAKVYANLIGVGAN